MNTKQILLLICTYFISLNISAQCDLHFEYENTGSNMTVLFTNSASQNISMFSDQGTIGAFYLSENGEYVCASAMNYHGSQTQLSLMADDSTTPEIDGFTSGDEIHWFYKDINGSIYQIETSPVDIFLLNSISIVQSAELNEIDCDISNPDVCEPLDYSYINTGANMTLALPNSSIQSINSLGNGMIGVFYYNDYGVLKCSGSTSIFGEETAFPAMADDMTTDEIDGFTNGQEMIWIFTNSNNTQYRLFPSPNQNYLINAVYYVGHFDYELNCSSSSDTFGCTDEFSCNYDPNATIEDGSCYNNDLGCGCNLPAAELGYDCYGNCLSDSDNDGICDVDEILGCTNEDACNYNNDATSDDGSCTFSTVASEYNLSVNPSNWGGNFNSIQSNNIVLIDESNDLGCHDLDIDLEGSIALIKRGDCQYSLKALNAQNAGATAVIIYNNSSGIMNMGSGNYSSQVHIPVFAMSGFDGSNLASYLSNLSLNYNISLEHDNCVINIASSDCDGNCLSDSDSDGICDEFESEGCVDPDACNYDVMATDDDGSCYNNDLGCGCDVPAALDGYDCHGNCLSDVDDDGICDDFEIYGCTESDANNFNPEATEDDGSCDYSVDCDGLLLNVSMHDSYGDGWNGNILIIGNEHLTLNHGSHDELNVCIDNTSECLEVICDGGHWQEEVSWSINDGVSHELLLEGGAPFEGSIGECLDTDPCLSLSYDYVNTGSNMTLVLPDAAIEFTEDLGEGYLGVFYSNTNGDLICSGSTYMNGQETAFPAMGDDSTTDEIDGLVTNQELLWIYTLDNGDQYYLTSFPHQGYTFNGIYYIEGFEYEPVNCLDVFGCSDEQANNYNSEANVDDGSCTYDVMGCTDEQANNYNSEANVDDGSCAYDVMGCTDEQANNYNSEANVDDGSCAYDVMGCTDEQANNYNSEANVDDGSCAYDVMGCTDEQANNYNSEANVDDGSCAYDVMGCTDEQANNYNSEANVDDGSCVYDGNNCGCTDPNYLEYYTQGYFAICSNNSCETPAQNAGLSSSSFNQPLNTSINLTLGLEINNLFIPNGTQIAAFYDLNQDGVINTNPLVTSSGQVYYECVGLTDFETSFFAMAIWGDDPLTEEVDGVPNGAENVLFALLTPDQSVVLFDIIPDQFTYSPNALYAINEINLSPEISGCTNIDYCNYNIYATIDDGSCSGSYGCMEQMYVDYDPIASCHNADLCDESWYDVFVVSEAQNEELSSTIIEMEVMMSDANATISSMTDMVDELTLMNAEMSSDLSASQAQNEELNSIITEMEVMMSDADSTISSMTYMVDELTLMNAEMSSDLSASQAQNEELNSTITEMEVMMSDANATISSMTDMVDELTLMNAEMSSDLSASQAQNEELNSIITEMEVMMSDADSTISSMTYMVDELTLMNAEMSSDLSASQAQNEELNSTITEMEVMMSDADSTISSMTDMVDDMTLTMSEMNIRISDLEYENDSLHNLLLSSQNELALSNYTVDSLMVTIDFMAIDYENMSSVNDSLSNPISIDLISGWNIIGYYLKNSQDAAATFENIIDILSIVKNNAGEVYWPEFGFNGIGDLIPGQGYQVLVDDYHEGFVFENLDGLRLELSPIIPQWAIDMEVYTHPNDIKTLVRVVNNLGQQVNPDDEFKGAILYYLYNDGTVEKHLK